jgi:hypothetical protein
MLAMQTSCHERSTPFKVGTQVEVWLCSTLPRPYPITKTMCSMFVWKPREFHVQYCSQEWLWYHIIKLRRRRQQTQNIHQRWLYKRPIKLLNFCRIYCRFTVLDTCKHSLTTSCTLQHWAWIGWYSTTDTIVDGGFDCHTNAVSVRETRVQQTTAVQRQGFSCSEFRDASTENPSTVLQNIALRFVSSVVRRCRVT